VRRSETPEIPDHVITFVEGELRDYPTNKRRRERLADELAERARDFRLEAPVRAPGSDPVFSAVSRLDKEPELAYLTRRLAIIDDALEALPERAARLVRFRYFRRMDPREAAERLGVGMRAFYTLRREAIWAIARQFGLV
jgi:DNA-directed RNA polymerase specialized sigma24 family protein